MIRIEGVPALRPNVIDYTVIPDRIEAGTFMLAAVITSGDITVNDVIPEHIEALTAKLREAGAEIAVKDESIRVMMKKRISPIDVVVLPYPGFPTDIQPQMTATLTLASGTSLLTENVFGGRFRYVDELVRMGANIRVEGRSAIVKGASRLTGAAVVAPDLRAGAALVLAGMAAEGETLLEGVQFIDRGYERIEDKLNSLGAEVKRVQD
jgi:UDP-N-acetylglucosamine 1-carboxyvinyltransferase